MAIKINDIIAQLKAKALEVDDTHAERVHTVPIHPTRISGAMHVSIIQMGNPGTREDDDKTMRTLEVEIGVATRVDPNSSTSTDAQLNAVYEPLHAKFEELRDGLAGYFETMNEDPSGPQYETVWDKQAIRLVSCTWNIKYTRSLGATE